MEGLTASAPNTQIQSTETHTSPEVPALAPETQQFYKDNPDLRLLFDDEFRSKVKDYWALVGYEDAAVPPSEEVLNAEADQALVREMGFFAKVYDGVMIMAQRGYDKVTALFDADQTIREAGFLANGQGADLARPAFPLVINALYEKLGSRLEVGLLTTIPDESLHASDGMKCLADVMDKVNPRFILSSTNYFNPKFDPKTNTKAIENDDKPSIVLDLASKAENSNRAFILFDDLKNVLRLNRAGTLQVGAMWVGQEVHDDIRRYAAMNSTEAAA